MTFSKVSVLIPTRGRVANLQRLIASYRATVGPDMAELVFRIDDDDAESMSFLGATSFQVVIGPRLNGYRSLPAFFDELRAVATGDLLMGGNDDMEFVTPDWPAMLLAKANEYPDGIFDLKVDTYNASVIPWFTVSRATVERLGHVMDPRLYWGDVYWRDVMGHLGRIVPVPVQIHHHWQGHHPDQTFRDAHQEEGRNWDEAYWARHRSCVAEAVETLQGAVCPA